MSRNVKTTIEYTADDILHEIEENEHVKLDRENLTLVVKHQILCQLRMAIGGKIVPDKNEEMVLKVDKFVYNVHGTRIY